MTVRLPVSSTLGLLVLGLATGGVATAQDAPVDPEGGDLGQWETGAAPASADTERPPALGGEERTETPAWNQSLDDERPGRRRSAEDGESAPGSSGGSDHAAFVGHVGVMYFGVTGVTIGDGTGGGNGTQVLPAPVVGARYWLSESLGLDLGIGIGYSTSTTTRDAPDGITDNPQRDLMGIAFHGGLPIVLHHAAHYGFLVIPELDFSFGSGTQYGNDPLGNLDVGLRGMTIMAGARAGAEIHFGFMGVPALALQGSVGLGFSIKQTTVEQPPPDNVTALTTTTTSVATTFQNNPWDLFTGSVAAVYYLP